MEEPTQGQAPATDDQELAKVLAGMNESAAAVAPADAPATDAAPTAATTTDPLQFEPSALPTPSDPTAPAVTPVSDPAALPTVAPAVAPATTTLTPELETLKKDALEELRPLVDKLDLPSEEKFDTLLLIIRSTDDQSLLTAAHTAAKAIEDETKRAQALLDVIKEIDYFGAQK